MTVTDTNTAKAYRHPWLGVEVRHLATLSAVARTGSFRQAARELGYVQSAVSQQIARLEHVVGAQLVERQRGQRNIRLTRIGQLLAQRGERILAELHAARIDLSLPESGGGEIRLAVAQDLASVLDRVLGAAREECSMAPLRMTEAIEVDELVRLLEQGAVDVAIGASLAAPSLAAVTLFHDPFVLLARSDSPLAQMRTVGRPGALTGEQLLVPTAVLAHTHVHAPGLRLDRAVRVPVAAAVAPLVAAGHGVGLLPRSAVHSGATELATVATVGLIPPQRIVLAWHASRRRTARLEAFCDRAAQCFLGDDRADVSRAA